MAWKKSEAQGRELVRVDRVSDGDTIMVMIGRRSEKVRLLGIDAPELGQRPWGRRSADHLRDIIRDSSRSVRLEYDVVDRDKYGRLLVYVRTSDGRLINEMMVRDGYAVLYTIPPNVRHSHLLERAQREARERKLGIWGRNGLEEMPEDYRRKHPRN